MKNRSKILGKEEVNRKINRIAHEIHEKNFEVKKIRLVGIADRGYMFAERLKKILDTETALEIKLNKLTINKDNPKDKIISDLDGESLKNEVVLLVDDVLNSGITLAYGVKHLLEFPVARLNTVILVNRQHPKFPISADYVGLTLATTMQEHIKVELSGSSEGIYLL